MPKSLLNRKRYYATSYGIENYIDIVNGKTTEIKKAARTMIDTIVLSIIAWWRKICHSKDTTNSKKKAD